jgi:hypothetical protein
MDTFEEECRMEPSLLIVLVVVAVVLIGWGLTRRRAQPAPPEAIRPEWADPRQRPALEPGYEYACLCGSPLDGPDACALDLHVYSLDSNQRETVNTATWADFDAARAQLLGDGWAEVYTELGRTPRLYFRRRAGRQAQLLPTDSNGRETCELICTPVGTDQWLISLQRHDPAGGKRHEKRPGPVAADQIQVEQRRLTHAGWEEVRRSQNGASLICTYRRRA